MSTKQTTDIVVEKANKTITITRAFAADLPLVWDAFTKPEILDQWWAPKPWKSRTKSMDFSEGGHRHYAMISPKGDEQEHWSLVNYKTIVPQKSFTSFDCFSDADRNINQNMPQSTGHTTFKPIENGSLVIFQKSFTDLAQLEAIVQMGFKEGITMAMDNLDQLLAQE